MSRACRHRRVESSWAEETIPLLKQLASRIARRRAEEEGADTLLVGERRRSRRLASAIRSERSEQIKHRIARRRAEDERADTLFRLSASGAEAINSTTA